MRWSLYGDAAAGGRLASDATSSSGTTWEFIPGSQEPTPSATTPVVTTPPTTTPPAGTVSATYRTTNMWSGGYQGDVTVTAGSAPINGWTVGWTLSSGQTISQVWNGTLSVSGSAVKVRNASYNGSLAATASTTFGFISTGTPTAPALTVTTP